MPLWDELEFAENDLTVRYRASDEPQELTLHVQLDHAEPDCIGPQRFVVVYDGMEYGAASGTEFHPKDAAVELLSGTFDFGPAGPDLVWVTRVRAISPFFIRNIVEHMRICGDEDNPVVAMSITGALATDDSPLSVTETQVRSWLETAGPYPGQWSDPGFPLTFSETMGASVRIQLQGSVNPAIEDHFQGMCYQWFIGTHEYANLHGEAVMDTEDRMARLLPKFAGTRRELSAMFEEFTRMPVPSRAYLVNMLTFFHHNVAPIASARVAI